MPIEFQRIDKDGGVTNRAVASWSRGEGGPLRLLMLGIASTKERSKN